MKYVISSAILWALVCLPAHAQELVLRSGDHPTFSRITIPVPASQAWTARWTASGVEVSLTGFKGSFDTSTVFTRMRRDRVTKIVQKKNTLAFGVTCDCIASAFRSGPLIVIDVADRGTTLAAPALEGGPAATKQAAEYIQTASAKRKLFALPWIGNESPFDTATNEIDSRVDPRVGSQTSHDSEQLLANRGKLLTQIQNTLSREVSEAASAGLLDPANNTISADPVEIKSATPVEVPLPRSLPIGLEGVSRNLRITSSMDRQTGRYAHGLEETSSGITCPDDNFLPIETWGNSSSFSAQVGPARGALTDARDRVDQNAAKALAQTYVYFGFGAEAISTLHLDPLLVQEFQHIADVAKILERDGIARPNSLSHFTDCPSNAALWATLSFEKLPADSIVDIDAVLLSLNKLPGHLRQIIAPKLSKRLLQYGDAAAAAMAMRSVERLPGELPATSVMAQANIAQNAGESAETLLKGVIEANNEQSPSALIQLVKNKLGANEPLSTETATLVEAYAQELRGTELGNELRQTQIIALSQSGRFQDAFNALEAILPAVSPETTVSLQNTIFEGLQKNADDLVFLEHTLSDQSNVIKKLPIATRLLITERLLNLGFAAQAQAVLSNVPESPRIPERQMLAARAALSLLQPFQAQAALIGISGAEAELILAQAKEMTGAYREASEIFTNNDAPRQAAEAAFLSDDWRELADNASTSFNAVAALSQTVANDPDLGELGRANSTLIESTKARDAIETLLNQPILQISPDS